MSKKLYNHELVTVSGEALAQLQAQVTETVTPWVELKKQALELASEFDAHIEERDALWQKAKELRSIDVSKGQLIAQIKRARSEHKKTVDAMTMNISKIAKKLEQAPAPDPEFDSLIHSRGTAIFKKACLDIATTFVSEQPAYKKLEEKAGELQAEIIRIQGEIDALPALLEQSEKEANELKVLAHDQEKHANEVYAELTRVRKEMKQYE